MNLDLTAYFHRIPKLIRWYYPEISWNRPSIQRTLFLTFDDGPVHDVTNFVLNQLKEYKAKATFFCVGQNIEEHPDILEKIIEYGHVVGNHSYTHLSGWNSKNNPYFEDVKKCQKVLFKKETTHKTLFRPPYGQVKKSQLEHLKKMGFEIMMWDYLIGDFDQSLSKEKCWKRAKSNIRNNDIIVFHDNEKSYDSLKYVLPKLLEHFSNLGFQFKSL